MRIYICFDSQALFFVFCVKQMAIYFLVIEFVIYWPTANINEQKLNWIETRYCNDIDALHTIFSPYTLINGVAICMYLLVVANNGSCHCNFHLFYCTWCRIQFHKKKKREFFLFVCSNGNCSREEKKKPNQIRKEKRIDWKYNFSRNENWNAHPKRFSHFIDVNSTRIWMKLVWGELDNLFSMLIYVSHREWAQHYALSIK